MTEPAYQREELDEVFADAIRCRNGKEHRREDHPDCLYCEAERLREAVKTLREAVKALLVRYNRKTFTEIELKLGNALSRTEPAKEQKPDDARS